MAIRDALTPNSLTAIYRNLLAITLGGFLVFGVTFGFLQPPGHAPDEEGHFLTGVVQLESLWGGASALPCLPYTFDEAFGVPNYNARILESIPSKAFRDAQSKPLNPRCHEKDYPHRVYGHAFTYPGLALARIAIRNPFEQPKLLVFFYLSRVLQLLMVFFVLLRFFILAYRSGSPTPGILILFGYCLTPIFIQQSQGISADTIINAYVICAASCLVFRHSITYTDVLIYSFLGLCAAFTKPVIMPICLSIAWLIWLKNSDFKAADWLKIPRNQVAWASLILSVGCGVAYAMQSGSGTLRPLSYANPSEQIAFVLSHPIKTTVLFLENFWRYLNPDHLMNSLGWRNVENLASTKNLWNEFMSLICVIEILGVIQVLRHNATQFFDKVSWRPILLNTTFALVGFFGLGFASILAMYLYWNPVGSQDVIAGLQPRYFIPVVLIGIGYVASVFANGSTATTPATSWTKPIWAQSLNFMVSVYAMFLVVRFIGTTSISLLINYY